MVGAVIFWLLAIVVLVVGAVWLVGTFVSGVVGVVKAGKL